MPNINEMKSSYFAGEDFKSGPQVFVISEVVQMTVGTEDPQTKWVLNFHGATRGCVLNTTRIDALGELISLNSDDWIEKVIELYFDPSIRFGNKPVGGIAIRLPTGTMPASQLSAAPAPIEPPAVPTTTPEQLGLSG